MEPIRQGTAGHSLQKTLTGGAFSYNKQAMRLVIFVIPLFVLSIFMKNHCFICRICYSVLKYQLFVIQKEENHYEIYT